jgi:DNA-binding NarL/FixJ family response regulator
MTKIAIIEDDPTINQMYRMKFEATGFDVQLASDGERGVALVESFRPDLILLDDGERPYTPLFWCDGQIGSLTYFGSDIADNLAMLSRSSSIYHNCSRLNGLRYNEVRDTGCRYNDAIPAQVFFDIFAVLVKHGYIVA